MFRLVSLAFLVVLTSNFNPAMAQPPATPPAAPQAAGGRGPRPPAPTRDPNTPGYVSAKELPDGANAPAKADGNFILGPTHNPAPEMTAQEGVPQGAVFNFTMESTDSKIYPGIAREANTFGEAATPRIPTKVIDQQPPRALHAQGGGVCPEAIRPGHGRAVHRGGGRTRRDVVHGAGQSDCPASCAGDDCASRSATAAATRREASAAWNTTPCRACTRSSSRRKCCRWWRSNTT